ncbi:MAG: hypothetical protein PUF12_01900 [Thermoflexaceae bacterium]|nr:hypothetical protein [Thermoflexaceae bacterium]
MNAVEKVRKLCKERKIPISKLESDLEFSNGYIGQLKKGVFPTDRAQKIANYLNMPFEYFLPEEEKEFGITTCSECGFTYDSEVDEDIREHENYHDLWKKAEIYFGELYCNYPVREKIKAINRNIRNNLDNPIKTRYRAEIEVLKCLFSRSVEAAKFDLRHVPFDKYVAMMMYGKHYRSKLDDELYSEIVKNFGTMPGIEDGKSYYEIPDDSVETIAAHKDEGNFTPDELRKIEEYKKLLIAARPKE